VKADQAEEDKIKASVAKYVADTKVAYKHLVGGVHFVDEIPKNPR
jgi:4-coumarate--CoA ligase